MPMNAITDGNVTTLIANDFDCDGTPNETDPDADDDVPDADECNATDGTVTTRY